MRTFWLVALGMVVVAIIVSGLIGGVVFYALEGGDDSTDRVVGVTMHCEIGTAPPKPAAGPDCTSALGHVYNERTEVTVRKDSGTTYTVNVPITATVSIGDPWPEP